MDQISYILTLHQQLGLRVRLTKFYLAPSQTLVLHLDTLLISLPESKVSKILKCGAGLPFSSNILPNLLLNLLIWRLCRRFSRRFGRFFEYW